MASKYIRKFKVPDGFENVLNDFAKEILRNQPKDILDFGIQYFKGLEEGKVLDYPDKGENRPENYKRPENQKPNIIAVDNQLDMSKEDLERLKRSQDKINEINQEVPIIKQPGEKKEPQPGEEEKQPEVKHDQGGIKIEIGKSEKEGQKNRYEDTDEKNDTYGKWFNKHSSGDLKPQIDAAKDEKEAFERPEPSKEPYNEWFDKHSSGSFEKKGEEEQKPAEGEQKPAEGEQKPVEGEQKPVEGEQKPDVEVPIKDMSKSPSPSNENYGEWFMKHSQENPNEKFNDVKDEPEPYERPDDKKISYTKWFRSHSRDNLVEGEEGEKKPEEGEKKQEEEKKPEEGEKKQEEEKKVVKETKEVVLEPDESVERIEIPYGEWFDKHSKDGLRIDNVKEETIPCERSDDEKRVTYSEWFYKHSCKKSEEGNNEDGGL